MEAKIAQLEAKLAAEYQQNMDRRNLLAAHLKLMEGLSTTTPYARYTKEESQQVLSQGYHKEFGRLRLQDRGVLRFKAEGFQERIEHRIGR